MSYIWYVGHWLFCFRIHWELYGSVHYNITDISKGWQVVVYIIVFTNLNKWGGHSEWNHIVLSFIIRRICTTTYDVFTLHYGNDISHEIIEKDAGRIIRLTYLYNVAYNATLCTIIPCFSTITTEEYLYKMAIEEVL